MAKLIVTKKENGEFRFSLVNHKNLVILTSKAFSTRTACLNGIELLKNSVSNNENIEKLIGGKGKPYFNVKTATIPSLAKSGLYDNEAKTSEGIREMQKELPNASLEFVKAEKKEVSETKPTQTQKDLTADFAPKNKPKKRSHYN